MNESAEPDDDLHEASCPSPIILPALEGDRPEWIAERRVIILSMDPYSHYVAYWNLVLRSCQEALGGNRATAVSYLRRVECWDWELLAYLGVAIEMIAPLRADNLGPAVIPELRRATLLGAVRMADAYLLDTAPKGDL